MNWAQINKFLDFSILNNSLRNIIGFVVVVFIGIGLRNLLTYLIGSLLIKILKKDEEEKIHLRKEFQEHVKKPLNTFIILIFTYFAFNFLQFPFGDTISIKAQTSLLTVLDKIYKLVLILSFSLVILRFVDFIEMLFRRRANKTISKVDDQLIPFFKELGKILIIIITFFFILGIVFQLNIASIIAGLGIGGLAVALAGKETLENLLASFTIFWDKPFIVGDSVKVGNYAGTVEKVGFRSTRLRTGEQTFLTIPNKMLTDQPLDNLTQRHYRKADININLMFNTPTETVKKIVAEIQAYLDQHQNLKHEDSKVFFNNFNSTSLELNVSMLVNKIDGNTFQTIKQEIYYNLLEIVKKHGAKLALPTSTIYMTSERDNIDEKDKKEVDKQKDNAKDEGSK